MHITSYFVGIALESEPFVSLFVRLHKYIKQHTLESAVIIHNILSLHISLYYFAKTLMEEEKMSIKEDCAKLFSMHKPITLSLIKCNYFSDDTKDRLCYLSCSESEIFKKINSYFAKKYHQEHASENQHSYIPHISLFTILDSVSYTPHKESIDQLINEELPKISRKSLIKNIQLFQVNSMFLPEIQIPVKD